MSLHLLWRLADIYICWLEQKLCSICFKEKKSHISIVDIIPFVWKSNNPQILLWYVHGNGPATRRYYKFISAFALDFPETRRNVIYSSKEPCLQAPSAPHRSLSCSNSRRHGSWSLLSSRCFPVSTTSSTPKSISRSPLLPLFSLPLVLSAVISIIWIIRRGEEKC